uniref:hypothetical protein n=1 Tax=Paractinoplanes polyasparticus TaxID=2856853 RepID=UPI001C84530A|nr:hypothetical protein [Actinoplanes polyasparticus]
MSDYAAAFIVMGLLTSGLLWTLGVVTNDYHQKINGRRGTLFTLATIAALVAVDVLVAELWGEPVETRTWLLAGCLVLAALLRVGAASGPARRLATSVTTARIDAAIASAGMSVAAATLVGLTVLYLLARGGLASLIGNLDNVLALAIMLGWAVKRLRDWRAPAAERVRQQWRHSQRGADGLPLRRSRLRRRRTVSPAGGAAAGVLAADLRAPSCGTSASKEGCDS